MSEKEKSSLVHKSYHNQIVKEYQQLLSYYQAKAELVDNLLYSIENDTVSNLVEFAERTRSKMYKMEKALEKEKFSKRNDKCI
jgi:hypothetical protein